MLQQWGSTTNYGYTISSKTSLLQALQEWGFSPLDDGGGRHKLVCPFHDDNDPSLVIYPDDRWWCFGCGFGGDVIDFAMRWKGISFREAAAAYATLSPHSVPKELLAFSDHEKLDTLAVVAAWARQMGKSAEPLLRKIREAWRAGDSFKISQLANPLPAELTSAVGYATLKPNTQEDADDSTRCAGTTKARGLQAG